MLNTYLAPMIPADIDFVLAHLWERGEVEAKKFDMESRAEIGRYMHGLPREFAWTIWHGFSPLAVLIAAKSDDGKHYTTFIATDSFPKAGLAATRILNRLFKDGLAENPHVALELWSASDHPMADKWFKCIGFERVEDQGLFRVYRGGAKNPVADKK